jgi:type I restriction enzyme, S subunit
MVGYNQTDIGLIPEDWEVKSMGLIGDTIIGLTYSPNNVSKYGTLVLRSSNIQNNQLAFKDNVFVDMELPNRVIVNENDILICVRNGSKRLIGKSTLIDKKTKGSAFGAFMSIYRSKSNLFIVNVFQSHIIQKQINEVLGATINQITNKDLASFQIPLPPPKEQESIAQVLSDTDALITVLEKRIAKKRLIKQGAMQTLLTPKDDWEVKKLDEVCDIKKGEQLNKDKMRDTEKYPVINGGVLPSGYTNKYNQVENTITISEGGNSCGYVNYMRVKFWQGGHCYSLKTTMNKSYLYSYLKFNEGIIMSLRVGSGLPNIQRNRLEEFNVFLPQTSEQTRIATILSDMDSEIDLLEKKLSKTKELKQGLMQQLLTGKIRLV